MPPTTARLAATLVASQHGHGEGPIWDEREGRVFWVDIASGHLHEVTIDGQHHRRRYVADELSAIVPRADGGWLATARHRLLWLDRDLQLEDTHHLDLPSGVRCNDAAVSPAGTLFFGTMAYDATPHGGALYSYDGRTVETLLPSVTISNGLAWSRDGDTLYFVDSATGTIDRLRYRPRPDRLDRREEVVRLPPAAGLADGITLDAEGALWVACYGGAQVLRYSPDGRPLDRLALPTPQVTSVAFAGPDLDRLVVTTGSEGLPGELDASWDQAGSLFHCRPGVPGVPLPEFVP